MQILGILNCTRDSFSDGGRYLDPAAARAHAFQMVVDGAAYIDVGAQSTRPEAEEVPVAEEIARLIPLISELRAAGVRVSADAYKPEVVRALLAQGIDILNDVTALRDPEAVAAVRDADCRVILMHSTSSGARAERLPMPAAEIVPRVVSFFEQRIAQLEQAGVARERVILDPGMGLFLGQDPQVSLVMLRNLDRLRVFGLPLCVSTTRKSFLGPLLGAPGAARPIAERGAGTLASELWALAAGVEFIRTHDVRALADAARIWNAIAEAPRSD